GCVFAGFVRVGWRGEGGPAHLPIAKSPDETPLPSPGGGAWNIECVLNAPVSEAALIPTPRRPAPPGEEEKAPWEPFLESAPPRLGAGELGFDTGADRGEPVHAYAWGQRGADWGRAGHLLIRAFDRFAAKDAVWSSALSRSPWADATIAGESFGYDSSG